MSLLCNSDFIMPARTRKSKKSARRQCRGSWRWGKIRIPGFGSRIPGKETNVSAADYADNADKIRFLLRLRRINPCPSVVPTFYSDFHSHFDIPCSIFEILFSGSRVPISGLFPFPLLVFPGIRSLKGLRNPPAAWIIPSTFNLGQSSDVKKRRRHGAAGDREVT